MRYEIWSENFRDYAWRLYAAHGVWSPFFGQPYIPEDTDYLEYLSFM